MAPMEQLSSGEKNEKPKEVQESNVGERIEALKRQGSGLYEKLKASFGNEVPQMPERLTHIEIAQWAMAEEIGMLKEFQEDEDPEKRMEAALGMMQAWDTEQFRIVDLASFTAADLTSQNG